uniref:Uncharacterized protein n=1 Tax=Arundo donax TaxID=35708 RepID=A0A0A8YA12_ARUDO
MLYILLIAHYHVLSKLEPNFFYKCTRDKALNIKATKADSPNSSACDNKFTYW